MVTLMNTDAWMLAYPSRFSLDPSSLWSRLPGVPRQMVLVAMVRVDLMP